jgi:hypothetical protein
MRPHVLLPLAAALLAQCSWSPEPNTDLGLRVYAAVQPRTVAIGDTSGVVRVLVMRANTGDTMIVNLRDSTPDRLAQPDWFPGKGIEVVIVTDTAAGFGPNVFTFGGSIDTVPPGVSGQYHDFPLRDWANDGFALEPGTYEVRVWYAGYDGHPATLTLTP